MEQSEILKLSSIKTTDIIVTEQIREKLLKLVGSMFVLNQRGKIGRVEYITQTSVKRKVSGGLIKTSVYEEVAVINSVVFTIVDEVGELVRREYSRKNLYDLEDFISYTLPDYVKYYKRIEYEQGVFDKNPISEN